MYSPFQQQGNSTSLHIPLCWEGRPGAGLTPLHSPPGDTPRLAETAYPALTATPPHRQWTCGAAWWNERGYGGTWCGERERGGDSFLIHISLSHPSSHPSLLLPAFLPSFPFLTSSLASFLPRSLSPAFLPRSLPPAFLPPSPLSPSLLHSPIHLHWVKLISLQNMHSYRLYMC